MQCDGKWPSCSRCLNRSIECRYPSQDGRQPAPKSYVQLLRSRIELLEKVLDMHGIDVNQSITQLNAARGDSFLASSDLDDLRSSFEGALCLDESTNFDRDGEARYFGPTSGRLEFHTGKSHVHIRGILCANMHLTGKGNVQLFLQARNLKRQVRPRPIMLPYQSRDYD